MGSENYTIITVDSNSEYFEEEVEYDPNKCIEVDDELSINCIKVSNDYFEKCIEVSGDIPFIDIYPDTNDYENPCDEIPKLPKISLKTINGSYPVEFENLEILDWDPLGKYPDLKKHYVKDFDKVVYEIENIDDYKNITEVYVYTNIDNVGWLFKKPSDLATYNEEDKIIELDVKDQLDGIDLELWVWIKDGDCWSDGGIYIVETMERSYTPYCHFSKNTYNTFDNIYFHFNQSSYDEKSKFFLQIVSNLDQCVFELPYSYYQTRDLLYTQEVFDGIDIKYTTNKYFDISFNATTQILRGATHFVAYLTVIEPYRYISFPSNCYFNLTMYDFNVDVSRIYVSGFVKGGGSPTGDREECSCDEFGKICSFAYDVDSILIRYVGCSGCAGNLNLCDFNLSSMLSFEVMLGVPQNSPIPLVSISGVSFLTNVVGTVNINTVESFSGTTLVGRYIEDTNNTHITWQIVVYTQGRA